MEITKNTLKTETIKYLNAMYQHLSNDEVKVSDFEKYYNNIMLAFKYNLISAEEAIEFWDLFICATVFAEYANESLLFFYNDDKDKLNNMINAVSIHKSVLYSIKKAGGINEYFEEIKGITQNSLLTPDEFYKCFTVCYFAFLYNIESFDLITYLNYLSNVFVNSKDKKEENKVNKAKSAIRHLIDETMAQRRKPKH